MNKVRFINTDSYYNLFPLLVSALKNGKQGLDGKNFVFCEEKVSLTAERFICRETGGSFNTEVFSFGNFLRSRAGNTGVLTREGASMAIKKILSENDFPRFDKVRKNLAPALYELIARLKSANVSAEDLARAAEKVTGVLSEKIKDVAKAYTIYDEYLRKAGLRDQSSALSLLPEIIEKDGEIKVADVFIVGYQGFTAQMRNVIESLIKSAKSVTCIFTYGKNEFAFVNETVSAVKKICKSAGAEWTEDFVPTEYSAGGKKIVSGLFCPGAFSAEKEEKPVARFLAARNAFAETERVAEVIRSRVMKKKARYRDFTVIVPDPELYAESVAKSFGLLSVPYFLDVKRKPENFPIVSLIYAYTDAFRRGRSAEVLSAFFKNPYVSDGGEFADDFENYLLKNCIAYEKFKKPFTDAPEGFEEFRARVCALLDKFNVRDLLKKLNAEEKTANLTERLNAAGETEDAAVNEQVYRKVSDLIDEMGVILGSVSMDADEFRSVFSGGVAAMEVSVIPQYSDAVFVGSFKQGALFKTETVFALGLTSDVPCSQEESAMLSDDEIDRLSEIRVLIEPKIKVINHRAKEETALGLACAEELFLSYPVSDLSGGQNVKSEIIDFFRENFRLSSFPEYDGYLTDEQGKRNFAREASRFATLKSDDFGKPTAFYYATDGEPKDIADRANKEIKTCLEPRARISGATSPSDIEAFFRCPFAAFVSRTLQVNKREDGEPDGRIIGTFAHEIFMRFCGEMDGAADEDAALRLFEKVKDETLQDPAYKRYDDGENAFKIAGITSECKKYCLKLFRWNRLSDYSTSEKDLEVPVNDHAGKRGYPAIRLCGGKVKLNGKIDRIDFCGDRFRIIDYKTGKNDVRDKDIFKGEKLQPFLYSLAVTDKTLAGAYYLNVSDEYLGESAERQFLKGKNLKGDADAEAEYLSGANDVSEEEMRAYAEYAKLVAEKAVSRMEDGCIIPSPSEDACKYCQFSAMCGKPLPERTVKNLGKGFIEKCVNGTKESKEFDDDGGNA